MPETKDFTLKFTSIDTLMRKDGFYVFKDIPATNAQVAANYSMIFTATSPCEVLIASEVHGTAGSAGGAVTLDIEKLTGTTAIGSGTSVLVTAFDLKGTANTPVRKSGTALSSARQLDTGDRLALKSSGTLTGLRDIQVTIYLKPLGKGDYR